MHATWIWKCFAEAGGPIHVALRAITPLRHGVYLPSWYRVPVTRD
jgi:hypothetical protein